MVLLEDGSARVQEAGREGGEKAKEGAGVAGRVRESSDIPVILPVMKARQLVHFKDTLL